MKKSLVIILISFVLTPFMNFSGTRSFAQSADNTDIVIIVNLERIDNQINLANAGIEKNQLDPAFAHAFIPHTTTFPSIKEELKKINQELTTDLEVKLTDLPIEIRTLGNSITDKQKATIKEDINAIKTMLDNLSSQVTGEIKDKVGFNAQIVVFLLRDAVQSYDIYQKGNSTILDQINYENSQGLVDKAFSNYKEISDSVGDRRNQEINAFFDDLIAAVDKKAPSQAVTKIVAAIERDLVEETLGSQSSNEYQSYFEEIRRLLSAVRSDVATGDYISADNNAISAYLDNYEFVEAPIEKEDPELMEETEILMRERLRELIAQETAPAEIEELIDLILLNLDKAEELVGTSADPGQIPNIPQPSQTFADIQALSQGFGQYTGQRLERGEAEDSAKSMVRGNIDAIRLKLDQVRQYYAEENFEQALITSRSAYLDSYENIEIPLRPIDPDFTLEMEIKFAELRNAIQSNQPITTIEQKISELKGGLDESERLVSGTGIVAPAIAFSTSFSIVFREGLESALIIGAILTYLEASRNERFKRHVYYGIVLAAAATAITWFVAEYIIDISGASRELIEAIAGISAVAVLFWVSFWVLNKIETKKWIEFVKAKVWKATATGSVLVFVMLSFFTIYREGFETVLFYQAMLSFAKYMEWYVVAGLVLGLAVIIGIAMIVRKLGKKLPLRVLFGLTMAIGAYMSIAFMGNAIREFQEVGYIQTTHMFGTIPRLDINLATMTGIHPTLETVLAQVILLAIYIAGSLYVLVLQPRRKKEIEMSRKSRADLTRPTDKETK